MENSQRVYAGIDMGLHLERASPARVHPPDTPHILAPALFRQFIHNDIISRKKSRRSTMRGCEVSFSWSSSLIS